MKSTLKITIFSSLLLITFASAPLYAESIDDKLKRLEQMLEAQQLKIDEQEAKLNSQTSTITKQKSTLDAYQLDLQILRYDVMQDSRGTGPAGASSMSLAENQNNQPQQPVGQAPPEVQQSKPEIGALADIGGVLTPSGTLIIEPSFQYAHSGVNRFTFRGIEILSSLAVGVFEASDTDRDSVTPALTGRLGLTNRLELELKVPYVYRDDTETAVIPTISDDEISRNLSGNGIGDIELALHYQLNNGQNGWPFFIANARFKTTTGDGPFDIARDSDGIGRELATGSGFYSFEPSITALFPSAPAVFFANAGYLINFEDDVNETFGDQMVGTVDPGDAVRFSFGMAYSINERAAFTLGFKNDWILKTKTEINNATFSSDRLTIASMLLGYSYQLTNKTNINLNLEFGMTDDAPDFLLTFRIPITSAKLWN